MAFIAIPSTWLEVGRAIKKQLFTRISDNLDDHETRINGVEAAQEGQAPLQFRVNGPYDAIVSSDKTNLLKIITQSDITITAVKLYIDEAGTVGTTEVNVLSNTKTGSFLTVLTTNPTVGFGDGDGSVSTDQVLDATNVDVDAGDTIRLDLIGSQTAGDSFTVIIEYDFR